MTGPPPRGFWRDNSLSLVFGGLLLAALGGQAVWGMIGYNEAARTAGLQQVSLGRYVTSSGFAVDVAENWQSEFLQFVLYIALTVWLVQRGSSESKTPGDEGRESDEQQLVGSFARPDSPTWARVGGWRTRIYSHSLVLVMALVFLASWSAQAVAGRVADNEERMRELLDPIGLGAYLVTPDFWGRTLQNWQSELLAIG
ncbi:MAG TPA: DUF6766 family protein, partial [Ornithinibacter sp.]|nr:DUF6766 family protein [Ornithinibacter sp.]